jgi:lysyl-tRNA synthetase class 2
MMIDCENLVRGLAASLGLVATICYQGTSIGLAGAWERLTVREAFARYGGFSMEEALARDMFDEIMVNDIEPRLGLTRPTFICDYPAERSALARLKPEDPSVAERFELYIGGVELANAFSELTDPLEQRRRFAAEAACREKQQRPAYPLPEPFLNELSAMPPSAGIALGVDRLVMVLTGAACIDEVVAFTPEEL